MIRWSLVVGLMLPATMGVSGASAQDVRETLLARGAPEAFADRVAAVVTMARAEGLPADALESKALEGWAKRGRVPPARVVSVLEQLVERFRGATELIEGAGVDPAPPGLVRAAGEALGRGLEPEDITSIVSDSPSADGAAVGITIATSLGAQGLEKAAAVAAVRSALREGRETDQLLEMPSVIADLISRGVPMSDVARDILEGGGLPLPANANAAGRGRPGSVPPGRGADAPGRGKKK